MKNLGRFVNVLTYVTWAAVMAMLGRRIQLSGARNCTTRGAPHRCDAEVHFVGGCSDVNRGPGNLLLHEAFESCCVCIQPHAKAGDTRDAQEALGDFKLGQSQSASKWCTLYACITVASQAQLDEW